MTKNKADDSEMKEIVLCMNYCYNGFANCYVILRVHKDFGTTVFTDYGDYITECVSGDELARVLMDLSEGKFA